MQNEVERLREIADEVEEIADNIDYERGENDTQKLGLINIRSALNATAQSLERGATLLEQWETLIK